MANEEKQSESRDIQVLENMDEEGRKNFLSNMGDVELLTARNGKVVASDDDRRNVAAFSNGIIAITPNSRWSPDVKAIMTRMRRANHNISHFLEVETAFILDLYERYDRSYNEERIVDLPDVERQKKLRELIEMAASRGASDIHMRVLKRYTEIRIRVFGRMQEVDSATPEEGLALIQAAFAVASDTGNSASMMSFQQGALQARSGLLPPSLDMLRLQYSPTSDQRGAMIARLKHVTPADEVEISSLGYSASQLRDIVTMRRRTNGLYILAGKVSSGKTTTLQRTLNKMYLEKNKEISMYTIEEPVELELPGAIQVPVKKQPDGTDGFVEAMKSSLRSDCNVIIVGEIRSQETAYLAIQAVMTGHALWSTVHAGTALGILDRLTDLGVENWKLQDPGIIRGLVYQRLCGVICDVCRINMEDGVKKGKVEEKVVTDLEEMFQQPRKNLYIRGPGCDKCKGGLKGRTVVAETVLTDPDLLEFYSKGQRREMFAHWTKPEDEGGLGGRPVMHHALAKVGAGLLDINEVEEEVDLLEAYTKAYPYLYERLRSDVEEVIRDFVK